MNISITQGSVIALRKIINTAFVNWEFEREQMNIAIDKIYDLLDVESAYENQKTSEDRDKFDDWIVEECFRLMVESSSEIANQLKTAASWWKHIVFPQYLLKSIVAHVENRGDENCFEIRSNAIVIFEILSVINEKMSEATYGVRG